MRQWEVSSGGGGAVDAPHLPFSMKAGFQFMTFSHYSIQVCASWASCRCSLSVQVPPPEEGLPKLVGADHDGAGRGHFEHSGQEP